MPPRKRDHGRHGQRERATGTPSPFSRPSYSVTPPHYPLHGFSSFGLPPFSLDFEDDDDEDEEYKGLSIEQKFEKLGLKIANEDGEMLAKARKDMEKVDELFNAGNLAAACSSYDAIISYVVENMPLDTDNYISASNLIASLHLKIAAGKLKLGDFDDVVSRCSLVLRNMDAKSVKAFVTRGQAYFNMEDYGPAKVDFEKALEIEPGNEEIKEECAKVVDKMAKLNSDSAIEDGVRKYNLRK